MEFSQILKLKWIKHKIVMQIVRINKTKVPTN